MLFKLPILPSLPLEPIVCCYLDSTNMWLQNAPDTGDVPQNTWPKINIEKYVTSALLFLYPVLVTAKVQSVINSKLQIT